jgi:hypothetical protein
VLPQVVWEVILDVEGWPRWAAYMKSLARQTDGPLALHSEVKVTPKGLPGNVWRVTEFEPPRSYTWVTRLAPGLDMSGGHVVEPAATGAKATFSLEASGPLATVASPVLSIVFNRNTRLATQGLKEFCES